MEAIRLVNSYRSKLIRTSNSGAARLPSRCRGKDNYDTGSQVIRKDTCYGWTPIDETDPCLETELRDRSTDRSFYWLTVTQFRASVENACCVYAFYDVHACTRTSLACSIRKFPISRAVILLRNCLPAGVWDRSKDKRLHESLRGVSLSSLERHGSPPSIFVYTFPPLLNSIGLLSRLFCYDGSR